jgi:hypothetical protein
MRPDKTRKRSDRPDRIFPANPPAVSGFYFGFILSRKCLAAG